MLDPHQLATFGGGCFWCLEAVFLRLEGVYSVTSGYAGGHVANPTYKDVCSGLTGHAEVVQIEFDPAIIPYDVLLKVFFTTHDPTTLNRQGADVGTQYRSVIYFHDAAQEQAAKAVIAQLTKEGVFPLPIVTEVTKLPPFYPAEDYHQDYYDRNTSAGYCQVVISPKVKKLKESFADRLKK